MVTTLPANLVKVQVKGTKLLTPLEAEVHGLTVETADEYQVADELLAGIARARKQWAAEIEPVLAPLRQAKSAADELNRKIDRPLEALYNTVRTKMGAFKQAEARVLLAAREEQEREQAKLQRQLEETAAREQTARTKQMRERLAAKREELEQQAEEVAEAPQAVKGAHSATRRIKKWRVVNMELLLRMIADGAGPEEVLILNEGYINAVMRSQPDVVASWPGFEVYEELIVAGR